jgi:hypothetical protein
MEDKYLQYFDFVVNGSIEVDVIRTDSGSDAEFEIFGLDINYYV